MADTTDTSSAGDDVHAISTPSPDKNTGNDGPDKLELPLPPLSDESGVQFRSFDNEWLKQGLTDTEFNRNYPPDPWGEEASDNARFWKLYQDRLGAADKNMLRTWNKTLDVLLIFAGLFSAVLTAFLIESYKSLQPDYAQYIATSLYISATSPENVQPPKLAPDLLIQTTSAQRITNRLWFIALFINLSVAFLSILVKQWLDEYVSHISASAQSLKQWSRRHQLYSRGINNWGLPSMISCLPALLHLSVFLFFLGLVLFLLPLDAAIAYTLLGLMMAMFAFYFLSILVPVWCIDCPSHTPFLRHITRLGHFVRSQLRYRMCRSLCGFLSCTSTWKAIESFPVVSALRKVASWLLQQILANRQAYRWRWPYTVSEEMHHIDAGRDELDASALATLLGSTTDPDAVAVCSDAFGSFNRAAGRLVYFMLEGSSLDDRFHAMLHYARPATITGTNRVSYARFVRAGLRASSSLKNMSSCGELVPELRSAFGLDGALLSILHDALEVRKIGSLESTSVDFVSHVVSQLKSTASQSSRDARRTTDRIPSGTVHRSICLLFLSALHRIHGTIMSRPDLRSLILLVFCAGDFAWSVTEDEQRVSDTALLALVELLTPEDKLRATTISPYFEVNAFLGRGFAPSVDYYQGFGSLCMIMSNPERYPLLPGVPDIVAGHLTQLVVPVDFPEEHPWSAIHPVSNLVLSSFFARHVALREDRLNAFAELIRSVTIDITDAHRLQYWQCFAALGKFGYILSTFSVMQWTESSQHGPAPRPRHVFMLGDDDVELFLHVFLAGENAVQTWSFRSWERYAIDCSIAGIGWSLPTLLALSLCRRVRQNIPSDNLVRAFFSGNALLSLFRDMVRHMCLMGYVKWFPQWLSLAKHCVQLSEWSFLQLYRWLWLEFVGTIDEESPRNAFAAERLTELQEALQPNGTLSGECEAGCLCRLGPTSVEADSAASRSIWRFLPCVTGDGVNTSSRGDSV